MIRGQRFELDLGEDDNQNEKQDDVALYGAFVGDILERKPASTLPPVAPKLKSKSGFPEHKTKNASSRFKQRNQSREAGDQTKKVTQNSPINEVATISESGHDGRAKTWEEEEKQRIDLENQQKLAQMSPEEIEAERRELMESLSPAFLQRLLQRSNIDSGAAEDNLSSLPESSARKKKITTKTVSFEEPVDDKASSPDTASNHDPPVDDQEVPLTEPLPHDSVHFPRPTQPPDLDPASGTFLEDLHQKYFPSLPSDPDKLEWMQPSATANTYDPSASALSPKDIRFSFKGELIPPQTASQIPVTAGLHHHGDAPDAAGYTIPELAHLAQSSFPAQRCIAFQTLGRILYRLGRGEFGDSGEPGADTVGAEDTFGELARGLWGEVEREKVIEILVLESEGNGVDRGRHVSAKAYATEAVWLWRRGGGRRWRAE